MSDDEWVTVASLSALPDGCPAAAQAETVDLVLVRQGPCVFALSGRCPHRWARLAEHGEVHGALLVCLRHGWDYRLDTGAPAQGEGDGLTSFPVQVGAGGEVRVQRAALREHARTSAPVFHDDEDVA